MQKLAILLLMMFPTHAALCVPPRRIEGCSVASIRGDAITLHCQNNAQVRLQPVTPAMLRVRVSPSGAVP